VVWEVGLGLVHEGFGMMGQQTEGVGGLKAEVGGAGLWAGEEGYPRQEELC